MTVDRIRAAIDLDARSIRPRLRYDAAHSDGRITCDELAGMAALMGTPWHIMGRLFVPCRGLFARACSLVEVEAGISIGCAISQPTQWDGTRRGVALEHAVSCSEGAPDPHKPDRAPR